MVASAGPGAVLDSLIDRFHARGRLRVWSVVITIFGDAVVPRGGRIALAGLRKLAGRLRIEPGALRTAMSRLAADGWVIRERVGRHSFFRLDERGRHSFDLATRRIYAPGPADWSGKWTVVIAPPGAAPEKAEPASVLGFVRVNGHVFIRPETKNAPRLEEDFPGMLVVHGQSAEHPEAFQTLWPSDEIAEHYRAFMSSHRPLLDALEQSGPLAPLDAMAARLLLIHDWRRIVLRDPGLPNALLPPDWPGEEARTLMRGIYARLASASEAWLDDAKLPPLNDRAAFNRRFKDRGSA